MARETEAERAARYAAMEAAEPVMDAARYERRQFFSFLTGITAAASGWGAWRWVQDNPADNNIPQVLRDTHELNEGLWRRLHRDTKLAPTYDRSESSLMRVNGRHGIRSEINLDSWALVLVDLGGRVARVVRLEEITALPFHEMTVEHKCVEGWSHIVTWGGCRFSDFLDLVQDDLEAGADAEYISLATPDGDYYVGMDRDSMIHPQTLLAWELQGEPLTLEHGAPLRLATPLKYGIKQIKRIGTIEMMDTQPDDYWFERGYDWYSHL